MRDAGDLTPDELLAAKTRIRAEQLSARRARPPEELVRARTAIRSALLDQCAHEGWLCVAAYVPLRTEPGSLELLAGLAALGVRVLTPVTLPDRDLEWTQWTGQERAASPLGRTAVADADAVLVPALAVAADGTRLGRGGGSYDRTLPRTTPGTPRIALLFDDELRAWLPRDPWDERVTEVVTPSGRVHVPWNTDVAGIR